MGFEESEREYWLQEFRLGHPVANVYRRRFTEDGYTAGELKPAPRGLALAKAKHQTVIDKVVSSVMSTEAARKELDLLDKDDGETWEPAKQDEYVGMFD